jgi:hypothetical protein
MELVNSRERSEGIKWIRSEANVKPMPMRRAHLFSKKIFSPPPPIHASAPSPPIPEPPGASDFLQRC